MKCEIGYCHQELERSKTMTGRPYMSCPLHGFRLWLAEGEERFEGVVKWALMGLGLFLVIVNVWRMAK